MAQMPPLPQQPVRQDVGLTRSELMPFRSTKISLRKSRILFPLLAVGLTCVLLFVLKMGLKSKDDVILYMNVLCAFMLFAMFSAIYFYAGERKNMLWYFVPATIVMLELVYRPIIAGFIYVFRSILPGDMKSPNEFLPNFIGMFFGAGLMEELMKAIPILLALGLAYYLRAKNSEGNWLTRNLALQGPLDGVLMGAAGGAGFIAVETMLMYVPNAMNANPSNAALSALQGILLMLPRVLNGLIGHMAYAGIFGYFIGLAVSHRRSFLTLFAVGWVLSSVLHAFWNSGVHLMGIYAFYASAALTGFFFLACLLKAKQLEVSRLGGPIDGHSVLAASPTPGTMPMGPAGVVPPPVPGLAGLFTGVASAAEALAGVTARTTVPNPGAVPADAMPAAPAPMPTTGLSIGNATARYALAANQSIDFSNLFGAAGVPPGFSGAILPTPDGALEISNTGHAPWTYATPDGAAVSVQPGASLRPVAGGKIMLGAATIEIASY